MNLQYIKIFLENNPDFADKDKLYKYFYDFLKCFDDPNNYLTSNEKQIINYINNNNEDEINKFIEKMFLEKINKYCNKNNVNYQHIIEKINDEKYKKILDAFKNENYENNDIMEIKLFYIIGNLFNARGHNDWRLKSLLKIIPNNRITLRKYIYYLLYKISFNNKFYFKKSINKDINYDFDILFQDFIHKKYNKFYYYLKTIKFNKRSYFYEYEYLFKIEIKDYFYFKLKYKKCDFRNDYHYFHYFKKNCIFTFKNNKCLLMFIIKK